MRFTTLAAASMALLLAGSAGAQGNTVVVTASDFRFEAPDSIPAGLTTFTLVNRGPEMHHVQIVRLEQGKTMADFQAAMQSHGPPPAWIRFLGGPNSPVPDGKTEVSVTLGVQPGNYVLLCLIPSADGMIHVAKGMVHPLKVTGPAARVSQAGAPKADATMTLYDYNFDLDAPITAGRRAIRIRNTAQQFHEVFIAKLPPNTEVTALMEWVSAGMKGQPPIVPMGGIVGLSSGEENVLVFDFEPGEYGLYCFLPDARDGKEHVQHGMFKKITIAARR